MLREQLFDAMVNSKSIAHQGRWWKIQSIQMEDGSGYCFNVTISNWEETKTVFVRCIRYPSMVIA